MTSNSGTLYLVATPIGNLSDISARAITILNQVDLIAAEDTRHSKGLLQHFNISTHMISLHQHNEKRQSQVLLTKLAQGQSIALISDAGTPLIHDPGFALVSLAHDHQISVVPIPGPCAAISALSASGLSASEFVFAGFLPATAKARQTQLAALEPETRTLIFYEAPHRIVALCRDLHTIFGDRLAVIAKELTKIHEAIIRAPIAELVTWLESDPVHQKGEFVMIVTGKAVSAQGELDAQSEQTLKILLAELPLKQAVSLASKITGSVRNKLYRRALDYEQSIFK